MSAENPQAILKSFRGSAGSEARRIRSKRQDNFACNLACFKVTGRLSDFYGRKRLAYECSILLRGSERDNFLMVLG